MKVSDIVGTDLKLFTPFGNKIIKQDIKQFFINLCSWNSGSQAPHARDINLILNSLESYGVIQLDKENPHSTGVYKVLSIGDEYIIPTTKSTLLRDRIDIDYVVDFNNKSFEQEVFRLDKDTPFETLVALQYLRKKMTSMERGIEFKLTLQQMGKLLKTKRCYYSGAILTLEGIHCHTIDRIDSNVGYTVDNSVACSRIVNNIKNKLIDDGVNLDGLSVIEMKKMLAKFIDIL